MRMPSWLRAVPFFLSAFLFMSGFFAIFSPLPLLILNLQANRKWFALAAVTNGAIVVATSGVTGLSFYAVYVLVLSFFLPLFLGKGRSIERAAVTTLMVMAFAAMLLVLVHAKVHDVNPITELKSQVSSAIDYLSANLSTDTRDNMMGNADPEEIKRNFLIELPWALSVSALIMVWINLTLVLRINAGRIRDRLGLSPTYFRMWKAPEVILWPTIAAGAGLVFADGWVSDVSLNLFKFFMAVYAIQGLSILGFLFDVWHLRGFFRALGFVIAIFLMMPLVLTLGFFDTWFDFRAKLSNKT